MLLFTHPAMMLHTPPGRHPEHAGRLAAVLEGLAPLKLAMREAPLAERSALERVHPAPYIDALDRVFPNEGERAVALDADTFLSAGSREAVYRAAGAVVAAVDAVLSGEDDMAFCAVRPPGHHAEPARPMGFCLFNNIAVGALHALEGHGLKRVAIVDFDVHHGNGTQSVAEAEPRLFSPLRIRRRSTRAPARRRSAARPATCSTRPWPKARMGVLGAGSWNLSRFLR